jgi:hypothetical protein
MKTWISMDRGCESHMTGIVICGENPDEHPRQNISTISVSADAQTRNASIVMARTTIRCYRQLKLKGTRAFNK